jgi:hypothetical protein
MKELNMTTIKEEVKLALDYLNKPTAKLEEHSENVGRAIATLNTCLLC